MSTCSSFRWVRRASWLAPAAVLGVLSACSTRQHVGPEATGRDPGEPVFPLTATLQELMDAQLDPAADFVWESVATISRQSGIEERQPRSEQEWLEVRRHALRLVEGTQLLVMKGRRVSREYIPASGYGGDLDSTEIQRRIDANRPAFVAFARGVHATSLRAIEAIDARDPQALFDAGSQLDQACENCHTTFWYPGLPR